MSKSIPPTSITKTQQALPKGKAETSSLIQASANVEPLLQSSSDIKERPSTVLALSAPDNQQSPTSEALTIRPRLPIPGGVDFYDIDWEYFFNNRDMGCPYHPAHNYVEFPKNADGTYDLKEFGKRIRIIGDYKQRLVRSGLIDRSQEPNVDAIIRDFSNPSSWLPNSVAALGDVSKLSSEYCKRVTNALINEANRLLEDGNIPRLFELIEHLFPFFVNSFAILEENLPEILHGEHILNAPHLISPSHDKHDYFPHFSSHYKDDSVAQKFADQMKQYPWAVYYFRRIKEGDCLKLKQTGQLLVDKIREERAPRLQD